MSMIPIAVTTNISVDRDTFLDTVAVIDRAGGLTVTLPAATGSGDVYRFYVKTTLTAAATIAALTTDIMQGTVAVSTDIGGTVAPTTATSDKLVMNGGTQGGLAGSYVEVRDVASATWFVTGALLSTSTEATPFSAT